MSATRYLSVMTLAVLLPLGARSEITNCTPITALPYTVSASGVYCLTGDLTTAMASDNAITINANVVTIDLNGNRLGGGLAGSGTQATGIYANDRQHITIRNGTIRGFSRGIYLAETAGQSTGHLIESICVDGNTKDAILMVGTNSVVRNNQVSNTGGTTVGVYDIARGIAVSGTSNRVLNNDVTHTFSSKVSSYVLGIYIVGADIVGKDKRVSNTTSSLDFSYAIWALAAARAQIVGNQISGGGGTHQVGIQLLEGSPSSVVRDNLISGFATYGVRFGLGATGVYSGNVVQDAATPYSGGTAHGATNYP